MSDQNRETQALAILLEKCPHIEARDERDPMDWKPKEQIDGDVHKRAADWLVAQGVRGPGAEPPKDFVLVKRELLEAATGAHERVHTNLCPACVARKRIQETVFGYGLQTRYEVIPKEEAVSPTPAAPSPTLTKCLAFFEEILTRWPDTSNTDCHLVLTQDVRTLRDELRAAVDRPSGDVGLREKDLTWEYETYGLLRECLDLLREESFPAPVTVVLKGRQADGLESWNYQLNTHLQRVRDKLRAALGERPS